jgi:hypothetical protein
MIDLVRKLNADEGESPLITNLVRLLIYVPNLKNVDLEGKQDLEEKDRKEHPATLLSI